MQTLEQFDALTSPAGQQLLARIAASTGDALALATSLRRDYPPEVVAAAMTLHELRQRASAKFSRAGAMWFTRAGYEQASSEAASRHRAERYRSFARVADLCTGIGGDLIGLAEHAEVLAVDRDPLHLALALANADVYGLRDRVTGLVADVTAVDLAGIEAVFIDPARRTGQGRLGANQTEPPLDWIFGLTGRVPAIGVKAAPGIDHERVPPGWEIEFVAEGRDLKESVLWSPAMATAARRATLLPGGWSFLAVPGDPVPVREPGAYLLDPNPAITRAGLVEDLARTLDAWKIDDLIAFLSTDQPVVTPWARTLRVIDALPWRLKEISARLQARGIGTVDIRRRGLAGDVDEIRKKLKLRGRGRATLAMTRVRDQPWCIIGVDPDAEQTT
jgi:SAM-dependent methyltransferase